MNKVVEWLESEEGERWSSSCHYKGDANNKNLVTVKDEEETVVYLWYSFDPQRFIGELALNQRLRAVHRIIISEGVSRQLGLLVSGTGESS